MRKHKTHFDVLHILTRNGWQWLCYEKDMLGTTTEYTQYKADFLGHSYSSTVVAIISNLPEHLNLDGHYGVLWLEAVYECERDGCLSWGDITDMQQAIIYAEENLLRIGMPFTPDYDFHGRNAANMKRRNDKLRRLYNMDEVEREAEKWTLATEYIKQLPSAQPERTCVNCGRTVNNGGWYADGRTRCPIEEHYALPKDGYCHLWEKRNVTDDDYPERREG